jgi:polar amino acid transport system substrate-binding protein
MKFILLAIAVSSLLTTSVSAECIKLLTTEHYPPLNYIKNNKLTGPAVDIIYAIQEQLNFKSKVEVYPWKRAYITTLNNHNTAIFSLARSTKRENLFKWVGPIASKQYALYALTTANIKLNSLNAAKGYSIGVQNGSIAEEYLISQGAKNVFPVTMPKQNLGKLLKGRIELWYVNTATLIEQAKLMSIPLQQLTKVLALKKEQLYIGFNKEVPDKTIELWQTIYENLYHQGVIKNIYVKYNLLNLYPDKLTN